MSVERTLTEVVTTHAAVICCVKGHFVCVQPRALLPRKNLQRQWRVAEGAWPPHHLQSLRVGCRKMGWDAICRLLSTDRVSGPLRRECAGGRRPSEPPKVTSRHELDA